MSFFCSSTSSTSGPLISKVAPRQVLSFLHRLDFIRNARPQSKQRNSLRTNRHLGPTAAGVEAWFITSLTRAGHCRNHTQKSLQTSTFFNCQRPDTSRRNREKNGITFQRFQHTNSEKVEGTGEPTSEKPTSEDPTTKEVRTEEPELEPPFYEPKPVLELEPELNRTREELLALVDDYHGESFTDQLPLLELPRLYQPSDGPHLTVSDKVEDEWPPPERAWPADTETKLKLQDLDLALLDFNKDSEEIYRLYIALPAPRVSYLEAKARHKMLRRLSIIERKDEHSMLRYLSVVDDMKNAAIPLTSHEWTSATSFVARYVTRSTEIEVEAALHMWKEMEQVAGVKGTSATFNVLFDVACKAGKFILADMIYKEMEKRGHQFNRFHHVSMIHYYGLRQNGDGARAAYKELVNAGEIVDTVVLNAMVSALIQSREAAAAENIYERMKNSYLERAGSQLPSRNYKSRRAFTVLLMKLAQKSKKYPNRREELQKKSILAPDLHTFRILINHFAVHAGELDTTARYMSEMAWFELPVHGALFVSLFKGFAIHGGIRYTQWSERRLENVWTSLLASLDEGVEELFISRWIVIWALRAFAKCSGKSRTMEIWEEVREKWNPGEEDLDFAMEQLRSLLEGVDMAQHRHDWVLGTGGR